MYKNSNKPFLRGYRTEKLVRFSLSMLGWRCIYHRWLNQINEIDLIFLRFNSIRFVEVKYRSNTSSVIDIFKQRYQNKLWKAAGLWISKHPQFSNFEFRFTIFIIGPKYWNWSINDLDPINKL